MRLGAFIGKFLSNPPRLLQAPNGDEAGDFPDWEVVGESHYQDNLWSVVGQKLDGRPQSPLRMFGRPDP